MWRLRGLLIALIVAVGTTSGAPALAQTDGRPASGKVYRLGVLALSDPFQLSGIPAPNSLRTVTFAELAKRGFVEGRDFVVELRFGPSERLPDLARELVALKPDVILAIGGPTVRALRAIANPLPVVMGAGGYDHAVGLLARPGDNYTGVVLPPPQQVDAKQLQLLHEAIPAARRIGVPIRPIVDENYLPAMRAVAEKLGMELVFHYVTGPADYPAAFTAMRAAGAQAVYIFDAAEFHRDGAMLAKLTLDTGLPAICGLPDMARDGCLMGHGMDIIKMRRRTADYVARIFQGTLPGELPIEELHMSFAINLKTARVLGVDVPPVLLARADEVFD